MSYVMQLDLKMHSK